MNIIIKKVIAREFLTLILVIVIGLISFLLTFPYNAFKHRQNENLKREIMVNIELIDSLSKSYKLKNQNQNWYFEKFSEVFDLGELNSTEKWWARTVQISKNDSISIKWKNVWTKDKTSINFLNSIGFSSCDSLQNFIVKNTTNSLDIMNENKSTQLEKQTNELTNRQSNVVSSVLSYQEQLAFLFNAILISGFILFGIRYLYYGVKWSFKTLKQKTE